MFQEYLDCEISIQPRNGEIYPFSISAPGGDARGELRLPIHDPSYQVLLSRLTSLETDEDTLTQIGQILYAALFTGQVKEVLVRSQGHLSEQQGLRLVLNIASSEQEVGAMPWEFLNDPDQGPLTMLDTSIVRYLPQPSKIPTLKTSLPLRLLLSAAQPGELAAINSARELDQIVEVLRPLEAAGALKLVVEPHLTRSKLQQLIRQGIHVWHFAGHGGFGRDGKTGALAFEDAQGDLEWASAMELGILLNRSSVRLILLDACETGQLSTAPFRSMAPALIRGQIPAVIAMQLKVNDMAAQSFAGEFYRALAEGFPIDACVTEGRKAVMGLVGLGRADWGIPVVYTRAPDGRLFDLPAQQSGGAPIVTEADQLSDTIQEQIKLALQTRRTVDMLKQRKAKMSIHVDVPTQHELEDSQRLLVHTLQQIVELREKHIQALAASGSPAELQLQARRELRESRIQSAEAEREVIQLSILGFEGRMPRQDQRIRELTAMIQELRGQKDEP